MGESADIGSPKKILCIIFLFRRKTINKMGNKRPVTVLGAGYTGLTTAAELTLRGFKVDVIASDLGYRPPLTIVGTQSRRWPGSAISNTTFNNDDLLDRELSTIQRFVALTSQFEETGVRIIPALKVSRKEGQSWNKRPLDANRLKAASEVQRSLRMISYPAKVKKEDIDAFKAVGYKSVDETQVVRIETDKYFKYLINMITTAGGSVELGVSLTKEGVEKMKKTRHVVNCLGNNAGIIGGGKGEYYSNPGEVVIWKRCPKDFDFYIMDDDMDAGVMQMPDGSGLYLSTAAKAGPDQTKTTVSDCDKVCQALFGETLSLSNGDGWESWKTDRPMRKEGFNIQATKTAGTNFVQVENSGQGGAGVAASWACSAKAVDALTEQLGGNRWAA